MSKSEHSLMTNPKPGFHWFNLGYGRELGFALALKFLLLFLLWWFLFAGNKKPVNPEIVADKLFGLEPSTLTTTSHNQEHNK